MNHEINNHIPKILGITFVVGILSVVVVVFLALSAEEEGIVRDIVKGIPILQDLIPQDITTETEVVNDIDNIEEDSSDLNDEADIDVIDDNSEQDKVVSIDVDEKENTDTINTFLSGSIVTQEGEKLFKELRLKEAKKIFIQVQDKDPVANYYLEMLVAYEHNNSATLAYMKRVKELGGNADLIMKSKEIIKAFDEFNLYKGSTDDHLAVLLGRSFINVGEVNLGIIKIKEAIKINPAYKDAYIILGSAYMILEDYSEAENNLVKALPIDRPEPNYYLGLARFNIGEYQKAILAFREALKLNYRPEIELRSKLGEALISVGKYDEALLEFNRVIEINPLDVGVYYEPIWVSINNFNNTEKALYYSELCLSNNPSNAMCHDYMGWVYIEANQYEMAKKYLDAAVVLDKNLASAYYHLGRYFESIGDFAHASQNFQLAISLEPNSVYGKESRKELSKFK